MEAEDNGADDAILLNYAENVAEGCTSNVFIVHSGVVLTPDLSSGVLAGTIRQTVLEVAADLGIPAEERAIKPALLESADEIFMTSSTREVAPVAHLNGKQVGNGKHKMAELFQREYRKRAEG
jgi:branched-subunit amino acid aminotransferase/4-amino-4-deoxychorismate lyase